MIKYATEMGIKQQKENYTPVKTYGRLDIERKKEQKREREKERKKKKEICNWKLEVFCVESLT
jgi:hypothetical protein